ncbi:MFS general substrate transporter [Byssothecium circinans]|uniref:MFS general substrate transporter n=1 Tax=Byssothecium circinans TaxID=147558 RepID=A0A6A5TSN7_9PLEO|nr:MFS general substrate transporter [Byssothecium circinans]
MALTTSTTVVDTMERPSSLSSHRLDSLWEDGNDTQRKRPESCNLPGTVFLISSDGRVLNLPIPSESPHDPLIWSWKKRLLALFAIAFFNFVGHASILALNTSIIGIYLEFDVRPFRIDHLTPAMQLFMAFGALFWAPLSLAIGRKAALLLACIIRIIGVTMIAYATNFNHLVVGVSIIGFSTAFARTLSFLIIIDLTFIHQRPSAFAIISGMVGTLATITISTIPYTTTYVHWRSFYRFWLFPCFASLLISMFCFPETYFKRPAIAFDGRILLQSATEKISFYKRDSGATSFATPTNNKALPRIPIPSRVAAYLDSYKIRRARSASWGAMGRTYGQCFSCLCNSMIICVILLIVVIWWGSIYVGINIARSPPKDTSGMLPGFGANMSCAAGLFLSWPTGGPLVWFVMKKLAKRNKGVREAEHYLVGFIIPVVVGTIGTLLYGFASEYRWKFGWSWFAYGLVSLGYGTLQINTALWLTESFPRWATAALVVVNGGNLLASFGLTLEMVPWSINFGVLNVGAVLAGLQVFVGLFLLPMAFWGKKARQRLNGRWENVREGAVRPQ